MQTRIEVLPPAQYEARWKTVHRTVFSGRVLDNRPFAPAGWRQMAIGAPSHDFAQDQAQMAPDRHRHALVYQSLLNAVRHRGDQEFVGCLQGGAHLHPAMFHCHSIVLASLYEMRTAPADEFDRQIFGPSAAWGLAVSWEEEVAVVAGTSAFLDLFTAACGGEDVVREDFLTSSAYLESVSDQTRTLRRNLLTQSGWT
jgi:hypothetical protein